VNFNNKATHYPKAEISLVQRSGSAPAKSLTRLRVGAPVPAAGSVLFGPENPHMSIGRPPRSDPRVSHSALRA
jgi:hypothetical protein